MPDVLTPEDRFSGILFALEIYIAAPAGNDANLMLEELIREWEDHYVVLRDDMSIFLKTRAFHSAVHFLKMRTQENLDDLVRRFIVAERQQKFDAQVQTLFVVFYNHCAPFTPSYGRIKGESV